MEKGVKEWSDVCQTPAKTLDLGGDWSLSKDALHWEAPTPLPGPVPEYRFAKRTFVCPKMETSTQVYVRYEGTRGGWTGVIINGRYLRRSHHNLTDFTHLNITPWVKPDGPNEIIILGDADRGQEITSVRLDFYE